MRILYYYQHFSTPQGATGTRGYEMARYLVERGHHVTMVCGSYAVGKTGLSGPAKRGRRRGMVDGIEVIELVLPYSNNDGFVRRSGTFLRFALSSIGIGLLGTYDLVFASSTPLTVAIPGIVTRLLRRTPFVFEVRDLWPELPREMGVITNPVILEALGALEWSAYHSADACIGLSPGIVEGIVRRGIPAENVAMIPNGCDNHRVASQGAGWQRPPSIAESDFVAIFTGAHGLANGLDRLLDAAAELMARGRRDIKLLLVGAGKLKAGLQERAQNEGLDICVFVDPMPKTQLFEVLQNVDAGLMLLANVPAFYYGTSPNKFFDYVSAGLPVLNNYPGWLADLIAEHQCGVAVPPDDPVAFANALEHLADHREEAKAMGQRSRKLARERFDRMKLAAQFADWLERRGR